MIRLLRERARPLKEIKYKLEDSALQIREKLIQIYIWHNSDLVNHWCNELYGACNEIQYTKGTHRYLNKKTILDCIYDMWADSFKMKFDSIIGDIEYKENKKVPFIDADDVLDFIHDYCNWLSSELSSKGRVQNNDVKNEVYSLIDKYFNT